MKTYEIWCLRYKNPVKLGTYTLLKSAKGYVKVLIGWHKEAGTAGKYEIRTV